MLTAGSQLTGSLTLPQRKGTQQRNKPPGKPIQRKPNSKARWLVNHRADLQNLRTSHTSLKEELTKQLPLEDRKKNWGRQKKKTDESPQPTGKIKTELLIKYQHQSSMIRSNTRTTKTEILLFLNPEFFYVFVHLFV
jgi:hypothetical protein